MAYYRIEQKGHRICVGCRKGYSPPHGLKNERRTDFCIKAGKTYRRNKKPLKTLLNALNGIV